MNQVRWPNYTEASIWAEIFWRKEKRWVSVDVGRNLFDFAESSRLKATFNVGVTNRMIVESENTVLKMNPCERFEEQKRQLERLDRMSNSGHFYGNQQQREWLENDEEFLHGDVQSEQEIVAANRTGIAAGSEQNKEVPQSAVKSFDRLLLTSHSSDEKVSEDGDTDSEVSIALQDYERDRLSRDIESQSERYPEEFRHSSFERESTEQSKKRKLNDYCYIFNTKEEPPSPANSFDSEVERVVLGDAIATAWRLKDGRSSANHRHPHRVDFKSSTTMEDQSLSLRKVPNRAVAMSQKHQSPPLLCELGSAVIVAASRYGILRDVTRRYKER